MDLSELRVGQKVVGFSGNHGMGPDHRIGTVTGHVTDRWGRHVSVQMDDGTTDSVPSLNGTATLRFDPRFPEHPIFRIVDGVGIGWYAVTEES